MTKDAFSSREKALENQFFRAVDQVLVERMRADIASENAREKLSEATGITNKTLLNELLEVGVEPVTLVAFSLLPLAQVAWADGTVDDEERQLVFNTAAALGCRDHSTGWELLQSWLNEEPDEELFRIWCEFASHIEKGLSLLSRGQLITTIVQRAKAVAEATGGVLGIGKTSPAERKVIKKIEASFSSLEMP